MQPPNSYPGESLYVKNLDLAIDDNGLWTSFEAFGAITLAWVMKNKDGTSKAFGFVNYTSLKDAEAAITELNGKILVSKPLYVAFAERGRKSYLKARHEQHRTAIDPGPNTQIVQKVSFTR